MENKVADTGSNTTYEEKYRQFQEKKKKERLERIAQTLHGHKYALPEKYTNDEYQSEVIRLNEGHHLVLAGAGCGKTDILAERIMYAINAGVDMEDMLCLTFTNRAARNMRERIEKRLTIPCNDSLFVGNLHRFCSTFLYKKNVITQTSNILDETDSESIISDFMEDVKLPKLTEKDNGIEVSWDICFKAQHLVYQLRHKHDKDILLNTEALSPFSRYVAIKFPSPRGHWYDFIDLYDSLDEAPIVLSFDSSEDMRIYRGTPNYDEAIKGILKVAKKYEEYKTKNELVDFDDLLLIGYDYFKEHNDDIKKYSWIQVDEVQDLNRLQLKIIDLLTDMSSPNVVIYLGDEQQAIYSFMGAKLDTMEYLKDQKCDGKVHRLYTNYRSPKYLLDVFNHFANYVLETDVDLLPRPFNTNDNDDGGRVFLESQYVDQEVGNVIEKALELYSTDKRTAILVPSNGIADEISELLDNKKVNHFKISGVDLFSTPEVQTILAHFNVVNFERNFIAWTRILYNLKVFRSAKDAREFYREMDKCFLTPVDFLHYEGKSYIANFVKDYQGDFIIFDTETTGLDIYNDDIVQIAAIKLHGGKIIDSYNSILYTDKEIPEFLGEIVNPLVEEYSSRKRKFEEDGINQYQEKSDGGVKKYFVKREEGFHDFIEFAKGCPILGHNVNYDYHILDYNLQRDCNIFNIAELFPVYYDTLKIMRIVEPGLMSYKLKNLLSRLNLEGANSHLADDDILATKSVADYACNKAIPVIPMQRDFIRQYSDKIKIFVERYQKYYLHTQKMLYTKNLSDKLPAMVEEMDYLYEGLVQDLRIKPIPKYQHMKDFFAYDALQNDTESSLNELLNKYIMDLNTYKEADLCDSSTIKEKLFVSTVHKAKGLEFENVIVVNVNDGVYPYFFNRDNPYRIKEDARKLYVAISRAKEKLVISYASRRRGISWRGNPYDMGIDRSPFLGSIKVFFETEYLDLD
ncbi:MAG: UvrD-helicase domain-containing protein [Bacteroidaceae bacterium]|nr:UvrD-helicase domain-containing protein [Bacteroidaceae bacterium]